MYLVANSHLQTTSPAATASNSHRSTAAFGQTSWVHGIAFILLCRDRIGASSAFACASEPAVGRRPPPPGPPIVP